MALTLSLTFGDPPSTQEFPGTPKALGDFLAQYFAITGGETFIPVNFGSTEPDADSRGYPWFKTDGSGNPIGWFSWNGSIWKQLNTNVPSGNTASRPAGAAEGDLYLDTDIGVELIFFNGAWITAAGSPGDVKFVKNATLAGALVINPGWIQDPDSLGRVIGAAGSGSGLTPRNYADSLGEEAHTLNIDEIPEHQHSFPWASYSGAFQNGSQPAGILPVVTGFGSTNSSSNPPTGEGGLAHNTMQPTVFYWALLKQ